MRGIMNMIKKNNANILMVLIIENNAERMKKKARGN